MTNKKEEKVRGQVTIGLMTYNNKDTLRRALEGLVYQDYPHKDLVIFDDCSTDGTHEICQDYAERFPFIRLFRNPKNVGCFQNLENLLMHISGEYFLWACPDDVYDEAFLTRCVHVMRTDVQSIIATSAVRIIYDDGRQCVFRYHDFSKPFSFRRMAKAIVRTKNSDGALTYYNSIIHMLVRTKYLPKIHGVCQFIACEELWVINALIWGSVVYIDEVLYKKHELTSLYAVRNPGYHALVSAPFARVRQAFRYVFSYCKTSIPWRKKALYVYAFWLVITVRLPHLALIAFKSFLLRGDARMFSGRFHKIYKKLGAGVRVAKDL